jgi:hypothetical protein
MAVQLPHQLMDIQPGRSRMRINRKTRHATMKTPKSHSREVHDDRCSSGEWPVLQRARFARIGTPSGAEVTVVMARILARDLLDLGSHTV